MHRSLLAVGPALIMMSCARALAQDVPHVAAATAATPQDYFLTLGPYGALVWGAFILGRGVNLSLSVRLADDDRKLIERGVQALENKP